jgi:3-methyladenine DNA glycosylase Mpg
MRSNFIINLLTVGQNDAPYGSSFMLKASSEASGVGTGVLIRAIEPTGCIAIMQRNRGTERVRDLARGPGRVCAALGMDRWLDGIDLFQAADRPFQNRTSGNIMC